MRLDERLIHAAATLLPRPRRDARREEWLADLAGADELGMSRAAVVGGALRAAVSEGIRSRRSAITPRRVIAAAAIGLGIVVVGAPAAAVAAYLISDARGVVTTEADADGGEREVHWRDYPGIPELDADEVLAGPSREEGEATGREMLAEIEEALTSELGLAWVPSVVVEDADLPRAQNYYGGYSLLRVLNIPSRQSTTVPATWAGKEQAIAIIEEVAARYGFGDLVLDHDRPGMSPEEKEEGFGGSTPETSAIVSGMLTGSTGQWVWFTLQDLALDTEGRFAEYGDTSISLMYGANGLLPEGDRAEFERRLAPYLGLERPVPLES